MKLLPVAVVLSLLDWKVSAFVVGPPRCTSPFATIATASASSTTRLFLEDWVADMIDGELWRENHKAEFERAWMEKNRGAVLQSMNANSNHQGVIEQLANEQAVDQRQLVKDKKLAQSNPQQYCADRCIATGYCEVYEDIFQFSPAEVVAFCNDCVLAEDEEPCEIPDAFYDLDFLKP